MKMVDWIDEDHFESPIAFGEWMGPWDGDQGYKYIDFNGLLWAEDTIAGLIDEWGTHPAVYAIQPVNEPMANSDQWALKIFYRNVRELMRERAPHLKFVFHDSFHDDPSEWSDLFDDDDIENVVVDNHYYRYPFEPENTSVEAVCDFYKAQVEKLKAHKYEVWIGEWSLATDNCALWIGGFNDGGTPDSC